MEHNYQRGVFEGATHDGGDARRDPPCLPEQRVDQAQGFRGDEGAIQLTSEAERVIQLGMEVARAEDRGVEPATTDSEQPVAAAVEQIEPGRVRRGAFVYVDSCPYATDPASLLGVKVGDRIAVTSPSPPAGQAESHESEVLSVGQDEFGLYLGVEWDDRRTGVRWSSIASTVVDEIRIVRRDGQALGGGADGPLAEAADDETEADTYPWSDATRWRPDDGGVDDLMLAATGGTRSEVRDELFGQLPDAQLGSREAMGWCGLLRHEGRSGGIILRQNQYGRRSVWSTDSDEELVDRWEEAEREYQAFETATRSRNDGPSIWVGSLSDYNAGVLHGVWLAATVELDELADAIQFMLRNSHEPDAEEYGVFDYDWFGQGVGSLLGEYPSLATVSKVAQGIAEHGEAFAAWASYVGPEQHEQLDRFEDHYLGEWDSTEAYAENYLEECEAYRLVDEAPEWLRPYIKVDVELYARDLEIDLHVAEKAGGGVFVFDPSA